MKPLCTGFLLVVAALVLACTPRSSPEEGPAEVLPEPTVAPGPSTPSATPPASPAVTPPVVRVFDESLLRGREFLLELPVHHPIAVRDPDLGPLGSDTQLSAVVKPFLLAAASGTLDEDTLSPRWAAYLKAWARRFQQQGWRDLAVRVGVPTSAEADEILVPVRVQTKEKAASGWAALVREGKQYKVSDIQLAEAALRTTPFDPESPPQEISSPSRR